MNTRIIALIGASGSGKTTLIERAVAARCDLQQVQSFTTRPREARDSASTYEFIDRDELNRRLAAGNVIQFDEYNGNFYGNDRSHFDAIGDRIGILAMTERGANVLVVLGYAVRVVKVLSIGAPIRPGREDVDRGRIDHVEASITVTNVFEPGGLDCAVRELVNSIDTAF